MENHFVVIIEGLVNFEEMMAHGFDLQSIVSKNGWDNFFDMLYCPTYPNLIKELWVNAFVQELNLERAILSIVSYVPINITPTSIANAINCEEEGVIPDILFWESYLPSHLIFDNLSDLSKVSNLNSKASVGYQVLISNLLPKNKDLDSLDSDENYFMLLLNSDMKINLPHVMFEYLKMSLLPFNEGSHVSFLMEGFFQISSFNKEWRKQ